jgi:hypothetical protein
MARKIVAVLLVVGLAGCASRTNYGECIGLNGDRNPKLRYEYSAWNIAMGIIFFGLVVPPIFVALDQLQCPVGPAPTTN